MSETTVDKLLKKEKRLHDLKAIKAEQLKQLKDCANRLFSSPDGKFFAKAVKANCGIFNAPVSLDPQQLAFDRGMAWMYVAFFRDLLDPKIVAEIEGGQ